ncbi:MAG TPA: hypothetical protein VFK97_00530 [Candidatus Saccharimonadales bacterium]|nr:hypothetical protein [Candidatus Saccharimonadales bacterium]
MHRWIIAAGQTLSPHQAIAGLVGAVVIVVVVFIANKRAKRQHHR